MKNNHHMLRTMKKELRKEEADEPPPTQADQLYTRLQLSMKKLSHPQEPHKPYAVPAKEPEVKVTLLKPTAAQSLTRRQLWTHWLKVRGKQTENSTRDLKTTAERLYEAVETAEGEVQADQLLWLLVALGVGIPQEVLRKMLGRAGRVKKQEWVQFCVDTTAVPRALEKMKGPEESSPSLISPDSFDLYHGQLLVSRLHSLFHQLQPIHDQLLQVWTYLDPQSTDSVHPEKVAEMLVRLGCTVEVRSARALMKQVLGEQMRIQRVEFLALFNKGLLHLHIAALTRLLPTSPMHFLLCTRFIIMTSLTPQAPDSEIIQRLAQLRPPTSYASYEEYADAMEKLLMPIGYIRPKSRPVSAPRVKSETLSLPFRPVEAAMPVVVESQGSPSHLLANLPIISREDAEELQRTDPNALLGKIIISAVRPVSEKASMRSTVTDLHFDKREKRHSLQESLFSETEVKAPLPQEDTSKLSSRPLSMTRRRRNYSRGSTAPSSTVPARRSTASSMRASSPLKVPGRTLHSEFDRLVEYVPDVAVGLFM